MIKTAKRKERGEGKEKQGEKFRAMGRVIKGEKEEAEKEGNEREQKQIKGNWKKRKSGDAWRYEHVVFSFTFQPYRYILQLLWGENCLLVHTAEMTNF